MSTKKQKKIKKRNSVAKFMNEFNRAQTHTDKKNDYKRKAKHKKRLDDED